mgnify:CR=1 FL=1
MCVNPPALTDEKYDSGILNAHIRTNEKMSEDVQMYHENMFQRRSLNKLFNQTICNSDRLSGHLFIDVFERLLDRFNEISDGYDHHLTNNKLVSEIFDIHNILAISP